MNKYNHYEKKQKKKKNKNKKLKTQIKINYHLLLIPDLGLHCLRVNGSYNRQGFASQDHEGPQMYLKYDEFGILLVQYKT